MQVKLAIVGEAWGKDEAEHQHAFVGASGRLLANLLAEVQIAPHPVDKFPSPRSLVAHWANLEANHGVKLFNTFNTRPEGNKIELFFGNSKEGDQNFPPFKRGKYILPQHRYHIEALHAALHRAKPNLILAVGATSAWATLFRTVKIGKVRGAFDYAGFGQFKVIPTYHPANIFRKWSNRVILLRDLHKARREAQYPEIRRTERWLVLDPTLEDVQEWSTRPADAYAVDIETNFGQISMISFARSRHDIICIPIHDYTNRETLSYWRSEDEVTVWKIINQMLRRPVVKIFQNGVYDLSYLLRAGMRPVMCCADTMLRHHYLFPELPKDLGSLGASYCDEIAWKTMRDDFNNGKRDE